MTSFKKIAYSKQLIYAKQGRKGKVKEGKGRKGREGRKEGKPSPCLGVKKLINAGPAGEILPAVSSSVEMRECS
ncbi:hypothetical protein MTR_3g035820 [Medicago truncatula]|uniref:Uncharacterized protein n=1 Tax=Medicago truncatula TaxID=3880 RepID=G7J112_MEDTR|nr:hypothetical protein MTR_3g035820 [Medicago truncatula]